MIKSRLPRCLIAAPTSNRHSHLLDSWIKHLKELTYPNFEIYLVDTSQDNGKYLERIKEKKIESDRVPWDPKKRHILQHLAFVREHIRKYFLKNDYDYLFFLDTDIFIPQNTIQRLLSHNKQTVGHPVPIYQKNPSDRPISSIFRSGFTILGQGADLYTMDEIDGYKDFVKRFLDNRLTEQEQKFHRFLIKDPHKPYLMKVHACGIGCCILKKEVLEKVPFRTHDTYIMGEDIWFFNECEDKHIDMWVDTEIEPEHRHVTWDPILNQQMAHKDFQAQLIIQRLK